MKKGNLYIVTAALLFLAGCTHQKDADNQQVDPALVESPVSAQGSSNDIGELPVFAFEKENHEFGEIKQGDKVSYDFKFRNTGKSPLIISTVSATCGCTVPEYSKDPVNPGDEGVVKVSFDSEGKSGMTSKTVTVLANTIPNTKVLTISADIITPETGK
ncbi:MAG TPA: DUF1573 domain-containing protein [Bacteroidia bacterium]|nr:DUF1573 domain-containing protein [Bacteroidia bacterium]HNU33881.1 DUF1573 domain-containing protein [Bacteroidia bacterium]